MVFKLDEGIMHSNITPEKITANLITKFIGQRIIYYSKITSTMDAARAEAKKKAPEGTTIIAKEQTAGRGRKERIWISPVGSLALSVILYPDLYLLPALVMLAPLAALRSINTVAKVKPQIKWPNDLLIGEKKVCGVLIENQMRGSKVDYAIIGIGINVNLNPSNFPEIPPMATSISHEIGKEISMLKLVQQLFIELEQLYITARQGTVPYEEWRDNMIILGRKVVVSSGETIYSGIAESVSPDGNLLLRLADGNLIKIIVGDASLVTN